MRGLAVWAVAAVVIFAASGLQAEEACKSADALGVSRSVEVDTTGGPWFGEPFGNPDFLKPGEVVLTFDDGPSPLTTRPILEALAAQCTKAVFFMVGEMAAEHPEMVREVAAQGHAIGTHTWSHANLKQRSFEAIKTQIEAAFTAVERAAGGPIAPFFRYPYLNDTPAAVAYLQGRNIGQFAVDIDTLDWLSRNAQSVVRRAMSGLQRRGRGIILLHDIHPSTAAAVPHLLAQLKAGGYKVVDLQPKATVETIAAYQPPVKTAQRSVVRRQFAGRSKTSGSQWKWPSW
jgi:peptidoglycan/xylan/chitin deacetylase (PgdA/CDA1 family)